MFSTRSAGCRRGCVHTHTLSGRSRGCSAPASAVETVLRDELTNDREQSHRPDSRRRPRTRRSLGALSPRASRKIPLPTTSQRAGCFFDCSHHRLAVVRLPPEHRQNPAGVRLAAAFVGGFFCCARIFFQARNSRKQEAERRQRKDLGPLFNS